MTRYAIYYAPDPDSALWAFGSSVLGYDAARGCDCAHMNEYGDWCNWTATPRTYGFHGTLKAPFYLRDGVSVARLEADVAALAARLAPSPPLDLRVAALGRFIALTPTEASPGLAEVASECVTELDHLRAPLDAADRARRLTQGLNAQEIAYLDQWGYPYVMDAFRFHMTLTGALDEAERASALHLLANAYGRIAAPVRIDALTLAEQSSRDARFVIRNRFALTAA